ncbi:MAG: hypothetical protein AAFY20_18995 [Cyanobacteria bacterium J06639_14]
MASLTTTQLPRDFTHPVCAYYRAELKRVTASIKRAYRTLRKEEWPKFIARHNGQPSDTALSLWRQTSRCTPSDIHRIVGLQGFVVAPIPSHTERDRDDWVHALFNWRDYCKYLQSPHPHPWHRFSIGDRVVLYKTHHAMAPQLKQLKGESANITGLQSAPTKEAKYRLLFADDSSWWVRDRYCISPKELEHLNT